MAEAVRERVASELERQAGVRLTRIEVEIADVLEERCE
jgi:uncharacterized alkaline shock family protein YloU